MTQLSPTIANSPASVTISLNPPETRGTSGPATVQYNVKDNAFKAGDPDINITISLSIREMDKYTFEDNTTKKTQSGKLQGGIASGSFNFSIKNIHDMSTPPLSFNLMLCAFADNEGEGTKQCTPTLVNVIK